MSACGQVDIKIDESLQSLEKLQLPDWFSEYLNLMKSILQKDRERAEKSGKLLDNLSLYYGYSETFLNALIAEDAMEKNIDYARNKYLSKDYAGSRQELDQALIRNSDVQKAQAKASGMIPFAYLSRVESNRREAEDTIKKFITVVDLIAAGSREQADRLFTEASQQHEALKAKRLHASDVMPEHTDWWSRQVDSILNDVRQLTAEIEGLLSQIQSLVEENKS